MGKGAKSFVATRIELFGCCSEAPALGPGEYSMATIVGGAAACNGAAQFNPTAGSCRLDIASYTVKYLSIA